MGFDFSKMLMGFAKSSFKAATKERGELGDDYDFREEYANEVDEWEAQVESLNDVYDEWDYDKDPVPYLQRFKQEYAEIEDYLKNTVKPFLAEHSKGYRKTDLNYIYKDLLERAKEIKTDFIKDTYPGMVADYKEFLKEEEERRRIEEEEATKWAAFTQSVLEKLQAYNEPVKQKTFLEGFDVNAYARQAIDDLVEAGRVERTKKGNAYFIVAK